DRDDPLFLSLEVVGAHHPYPRLDHFGYLGLTKETEDWLGEHVPESVIAHLVERPEPPAPGGDDPSSVAQEHVLAVARGLRRPDAGHRLLLAPMPVAFGPGRGSGIAYSCDPATGAAGLHGGYRVGAAGAEFLADGGQDLDTDAPHQPWAGQLAAVVGEEAERRRFPVRVAFTVEPGRLWIMSVNEAPLVGPALVRALASLVRARTLTADSAVGLIGETMFTEVAAAPVTTAGMPLAARGLGVSPGVAGGVSVFDPADAVAEQAAGRPAVLVLVESRPEDLDGLLASCAVVTERGGRTAHAAVVTRSLGIPCVTALRDCSVDRAARTLVLADGRRVPAGTWITVNGTAGTVHFGAAAPSGAYCEAQEDLNWLVRSATAQGSLELRVNADSADDTERGIRGGARGVGLCRVEHMFLGERKALLERVLLHSRGPGSREDMAALARVLRDEFAHVLRAADGLPVAVRLLDPPRHEFLPDLPDLAVRAYREQAGGDGAEATELLRTVRALHEHNPMLGVRGVRLALTAPELAVAQVRALLEAAALLRAQGADPRPELLIPMVAMPGEIRAVRGLVAEARAQLGAAGDIALPVGAMVETPRAALLAGKLAGSADFLSLGTNDLTALTWGLSRDDAEREVIPLYQELGMMSDSPFCELLEDGVGELLRCAVERAREVKPEIPIGVCGEQAGESAAARFLAGIGVDYLSCSPGRISATRFAVIRAGKTDRKAERSIT
ncbi:putative PEP-binding protein, partial [Streptomyces odontomachi]|uniref:putative PEP-binding protein n=1 Tax=Streptomyces odontomachi TaxID=2944940 RepID=UPI002109F85B